MPDPSEEPQPPPRTTPEVPDPNASQTEQILGKPALHEPEIDPKWKRFYDKLLQERDRLIDAIRDLGGNAREITTRPLQDSIAEVGTENFQRDELLGVASFDQQRLAEVNNAIAKIQDGSYGVCEATGKPIPEARLEAVPWTRFTVEAEKEMEARGEVATVSIGGLGSTGRSGPETTAEIVNQKSA